MRRWPLVILLLCLGGLIGWAVFRQNRTYSDTALRPPPALAAPQRGDAELEPVRELVVEEANRASVQRESIEATPPKQNAVSVPAPKSATPERGLRLRLINLSGQALAERSFQLAAFVGPFKNQVQVEHGTANSDREGQVLFPLPADAPCDLRLLKITEVGRQAYGWLEGLEVPMLGIFDGGDVVVSEPRELHPEPILTGWVFDQADQPIPQAAGFLSEMHTSVSGEEVDTTPRKPWTCQVVVAEDGSFKAYGPLDRDIDAMFTMAAVGFEDHMEFGLSLPRFDLRVVLSRVVNLRGILLVPPDGPPLTEYGVWISDENGGTGISPNAEGRFSAIGNTRSLEISVTHPGLGVKLFRETFALSPQSDGDIGVIDLRPDLWVVDLKLIDSEGQPLANREITISLGADLERSDWYRTDGEGRLLTVLPRSSQQAEIGLTNHKSVPVTLAALPSELQLP